MKSTTSLLKFRKILREIKDLTKAFDRAKNSLKRWGDLPSGPDHLQLAREIVKLRKTLANLVSTRFVEKLPDSPKEPDYSMTGAFHINPHEPKVLVKQTGHSKPKLVIGKERESVETEAISVAMRDYLPGGWTYRNGNGKTRGFR